MLGLSGELEAAGQINVLTIRRRFRTEERGPARMIASMRSEFEDAAQVDEVEWSRVEKSTQQMRE